MEKQSNIGKIALLFAYCFGCIIVPVVVGLVVVFAFAPDPYLPQQDLLKVTAGNFVTPEAALGTEARLTPTIGQLLPETLVAEAQAVVEAEYAGDAQLALAAFAAEKAKAGRASLLDSIPRKQTSYTPGKVRYTRSDNGRSGLIVVVGNYLIAIEAPEVEPLYRILESLPAVVDNPDPGIMIIFTENYLALFLGLLLFYILIQLLIWPRLGTWASRVMAPADLQRVSATELRDSLLKLNEQDLPFMISEGKKSNELIASWRYTDSRWVSLMSKGGITGLARIRLRLDEKKKLVRAQDNISSIQWQEAAGGVMSANLRFSAFKGIVFAQYEWGVSYGVVFKNGKLEVDSLYDYSFSMAELKNPLIEIITGSGWDYNPVVTFIRLFN
jgi:hypothetical protein